MSQGLDQMIKALTCEPPRRIELRTYSLRVNRSAD
jgi:hypothetical protein